MIKTLMFNLGSNDCTVYMVGGEQTILHQEFYLDRFDEATELISVANLCSRFVRSGIYAGMKFRETASLLTRIRLMPMLLRFNLKLKLNGLYITEDDYFEALFLQEPKAMSKLLNADQQYLMEGLKNTRFLKL